MDFRKTVNALNANLIQINEINTAGPRHAINFRGGVHGRAIARPCKPPAGQ